MLGPIRSTPTLLSSDSVSGTLIRPRPIPPRTIGSTRFGKYGMPRLIVEPYSIAPSSTMAPTNTTTRGGNRVTSRDDVPNPMATAMAYGMKPIAARSGL